jgi:hypothetical protein
MHWFTGLVTFAFLWNDKDNKESQWHNIEKQTYGLYSHQNGKWLSFWTFFLEYAGELRTIILRRKKGIDPQTVHAFTNYIRTCVKWLPDQSSTTLT